MLTWSHAQVKGEGVCCPGEPQVPPRTRFPLSSNSGVPCCQTHQDWGAAPRLTSLCPPSQEWQGRSLSCWPDPRSCRPSASVRHAIRCSGNAASGAPCGWGSNYLMQNLNDLRTYNIQSMNAIYWISNLSATNKCYHYSTWIRPTNGTQNQNFNHLKFNICFQNLII